MFRIAQKASVKYLACTAAETMDFLVHGFCTRQGGVSAPPRASLNVSVREGDSEGQVRRNLERIAASFGISVGQFVFIHQVHQDGVWVIDGPLPPAAVAPPPAYDAIVTDRPGLALCIRTADCVPVFLVDPVRRVIGAVHAGWKGTALQIAEKTVGEMVHRLGCRPEDIEAFIGPAIGPCCYQVDAGVYLAMDHHRDRDSFFHSGQAEGKWMLDLPLANRYQLIHSGLLPECILAADRCTACHPDLFFSHRGERGKTGRQLNFIMLDPGTSAV